MSLVLYCAMRAWSNSWEKAVLESEPYLKTLFSIALWASIAGLLYQCYRLAEEEIGKVQATSVAVQGLQEELIDLKSSLEESVGSLSHHVNRTIEATAAAIEHMTTIQRSGAERLKAELVAGPLAQEMGQVKTSTTESLQSLRARLQFIEQRYQELHEVMPHPATTGEMADNLETVKTELRDIRQVVTVLAPALDKVMLWAKRGEARGVYDRHWALLSSPSW
jgi:septation ring formation regulator EzrA